MKIKRLQKPLCGIALTLSIGGWQVWAQQYPEQAPPPDPNAPSYQPGPPPSPEGPSQGGWRKFGDRPSDGQGPYAPPAYDRQSAGQPYGQPPAYDRQTQPPQSYGSPYPNGQQSYGAPPRSDRPSNGQNYGPPPAPVDVPPEFAIPGGTWITVRVNQPISTDHNQVGDYWSGTLEKPIVVNGFVIARRGQTVAGRVAVVEKAGHVKGVSSLGVEVTELSLADGQQVPVKTQLVERRGNTSVGEDVAGIGAATGIGAAIGAAAGGGFGAGMGAIAGAGAATIGVLSTRGRATAIFPETPITFRLEHPLTIVVAPGSQAFRPATQYDYDEPQRRLTQRYGGPGPGPGPYGPPAPAPYYYGYGYGYPYPYYYGPSFYFYSGPRVYYRGYYRR